MSSFFCEDFLSLWPSGRLLLLLLLLLHLLFESYIFTLEFQATVPQSLKFKIFPMSTHAPPISPSCFMHVIKFRGE